MDAASGSVASCFASPMVREEKALFVRGEEALNFRGEDAPCVGAWASTSASGLGPKSRSPVRRPAPPWALFCIVGVQ
jgi:hypothetical protein